MRNRNKGPFTRTNGSIRSGKVRLIDPSGEMLGIVGTKEALRMAQDLGLDLIEVAASAEPPVCRIYSYSKWKYEQDQKDKDKRKNHVETKEFKFNVRIGEGDIGVKCRKISEALDDGDRVRVVVQMKGRERSHPELAQSLMEKILKAVEGHGKLEGKVSGDGSRLNAQLLPKKG